MLFECALIISNHEVYMKNKIISIPIANCRKRIIYIKHNIETATRRCLMRNLNI